MFEKFTDRGRRVVVLAHQEAAGLGSDSVGVEHLLLGLLSERSSLAARVLSSAGMDHAKALVLVGEIHSSDQRDPTGEPSFTDKALEVLEAAGTESEAMGHQFVSPEHLLISVIGSDEPNSRAVLEALSIEPPVLADTLRRSISEEARKATGSEDLRDVPLGQVCTACGAAVQEHGRVQDLELGVEQREPIHVHAYFCGECGSTIGLVKGP